MIASVISSCLREPHGLGDALLTFEWTSRRVSRMDLLDSLLLRHNALCGVVVEKVCRVLVRGCN